MASGGIRSIDRLLIANRGEIAVRIARSARRLGISTVGVHSGVDRSSFHLEMVDSAVALPGTPADSYLNPHALVRAAIRAGADAVHPGYGFLAESPEFAAAVSDAGLIWVGPDPDHIRLLGDKIAAKQAAVDAGVPTTPFVRVRADGGFKRSELPPLPVLVKAAAGGGGRGMRIVERVEDLDGAIEAASRESAAAFGDGTVFIEPFLPNGRHIEVQIFGDTLGNVVHLGDRECSIQRRNQKVIEEAPSAGIGADTRAGLLEGAVALASAVGYVGAGTVEFMVSSDEQVVTFLEVNTRLQVEHPVTEAITDTDLVEWQLTVAAGAPLPLDQAAIDERLARGYSSIEARLVAEDPGRGWMPSTGTLAAFDLAGAAGIRIDSGYRPGSVVSTEFDSLLAKVISTDLDRQVAARRLSRALNESIIVGVNTNAGLLANLLREPDFLAAQTFTDYLDTHPIEPGTISTASCDADAGDAELADCLLADFLLVAAAFAVQRHHRASDRVTGFAPSGWRNLATIGQRRSFVVAGTTVALHIEYRMLGPQWSPPDQGVDGQPSWGRAMVLFGAPPVADDSGALAPDGRRSYEVGFAIVDDVDGPGAARSEVTVEIDGIRRTIRTLTVPDPSQQTDLSVATACSEASAVFGLLPRFTDPDPASLGHGPVSPLPGTVIAVHVREGQRVEAGQPMAVVEAMKMEHSIVADADGLVTQVMFDVGDRVDAGDLLVELSAETDGGG